MHYAQEPICVVHLGICSQIQTLPGHQALNNIENVSKYINSDRGEGCTKCQDVE